MKSLKIFVWFASLLIAVPAVADDVTIFNPAPILYQQTTNSPCVIGESSCQNNGFPMTSLPNGSPSSYPLTTSPSYSVSTLTALLGTNSFFVGMDLNQATGKGPQTLTVFNVLINGVVVYSLPAPVVVPTANNGNGYADYLLAGPGFLAFSMAGLNPTDLISFQIAMNPQNDGKEQWFLIAGPGNEIVTPEPASLFLMGTGLIGFGSVVRKRLKK